MQVLWHFPFRFVGLISDIAMTGRALEGCQGQCELSILSAIKPEPPAHPTVSIEVRSPNEVGRMWKGYLECALDGHNPWKDTPAWEVGVPELLRDDG